MPLLRVITCLAIMAASLSFISSATPGFIQNQGQVDGGVAYYLPGPRTQIYLTPQAMVLDLKEDSRVSEDEPGAGGHRLPSDERDRAVATRPRRGSAVWIWFDGANPFPSIEARGGCPEYYNFFHGQDPQAWHVGVPAYEEVIYRELWPGMDLVCRVAPGGLSYELMPTATAEAAPLRFRYEGAERVQQGEDGAYLIETAAGAFADLRPTPGRPRGAISLVGTVTPSCAEPLRDNPEALLWGTYLGGGAGDGAYAVVLDPSGNPVVTGYTLSADFPTTPGAYDETYNASFDVFVSKLSASGSNLIWSTFLGGSLDDFGNAIAIGPNDNLVVTGRTRSTDFPTTAGAFDPTHNGYYDVFVAKLSDAGTSLIWSTYLGGDDEDEGSALVVGPLPGAQVTLTGETTSGDFPTTPGAFDRICNPPDAFVTRLDYSGTTLLWSTFLGGSSLDDGQGIVLDENLHPIVTGQTWSNDFPVTPGAYSTSFNGGRADAIVAKLELDGSGLVWSTYLGGSDEDRGQAVALGNFGRPVVTGMTFSPDFPTTAGAYDESYNGGDYDAFVTKLSAVGDALRWSTFLGGSGSDHGLRMAIGPADDPVIMGWTGSVDLPTTQGTYDASYNGEVDAFVADLTARGDELVWCTYLGACDHDWGYGLAVDPLTKDVAVAGVTYCLDFPTTPGAYDETFNGPPSDAFVVKLDDSELAWVEERPAGEISSSPGLQLFAPTLFNTTTRIEYSVPERCSGAPLQLAILDAAGRMVLTLVERVHVAGTYAVTWDGAGPAGAAVPSGVYYCVLRCEEKGQTARLMLVR